MSAPITNTVSTFIDSQLPQFIRENDPNFGAFIKAYYEWMEQSNNSAIIAQSKALLSYNDVDTTTDAFIQYFINDFLPFFPNDVALDERKLIKAARNFYQKKGSVESVQFLFRVLYGKEADIYFPKENILKASDGKWTLPQALRLVLSRGHLDFDINLLVGRQGLGSTSNASCVIEAATKTIDQGTGIELVELYISNIKQEFADLEDLNVVYGFTEDGFPLVFSEKIIASLSNILINPQHRGLRYRGLKEDSLGNITYTGDPVVISGGLQSNDLAAQKAVAFVGNVTSGSIVSVNVGFGGFGYRISPNTIVTVVNDPTDNTGAGANVIVQTIDTVNSVFVNVCTDAILYEANVFLNAASYNFANDVFANANTALNAAFSFANLQFGSITSMNVTNGGGAYTAVPTLNLAVTYYTDLLVNLVTGAANTLTIQQNMQFMDDLGLFCNVVVNAGGTGYSNVTDRIVVPSAIGHGATFDFITNGGGGVTEVLVTNRGEGYTFLPSALLFANTANVLNAAAGTGADITGFGFGQDASLGLSVSKIGQIIDFRIVSRGFDYVSTPNVSLRVEDLIINPIDPLLSFVTDSQIYQGTSANSATWVATVDSYNVESSVLRVYDYQGALDIFSNLVATTLNATVNITQTGNVVVYGDGQARANAIFLNGLIQYPGFYMTTDGFLSSDQYLQDSAKYHNYSYVIVVEKALIEYKKTLMQLVHPIGTSMLGQYAVIDDVPNAITSEGNVNIIPVVGGTVSSNAFSDGILVGSGTSFSTVGNVGDMIIFNTADTGRWLQAKIITSIVNAEYALLESNTTFEYYPASAANGSNTISAINALGNIAISDVVRINVNGNIVITNVLAIVQNVITGDTVFNDNVVNTVITVYPSINAASYSIVQNAT